MSSTRTYGCKQLKRDHDEVADAVQKKRKLAHELISTGSKPTSSPAPRMVKRMLGRSKTESSLESESTPSIALADMVSRTISLPAVPSPATSPSSTPQPPPVSSHKRATLARTYAGASRSFLSKDSVLLGGQLSSADDTRESYASLRKRLGVDNSDDNYPSIPGRRSLSGSLSSTPNVSPSRSPQKLRKTRSGSTFEELAVPEPLPDGMMNPLKSVSELTNKGESRRFLDEVGYLFEGLEKSVGLGLKRTTAMEINTSLCDPDFLRKAKAADFFVQCYDLLLEAGAGQGQDPTLDILLLLFIALVARDTASVLDMSRRSTSSLSLRAVLWSQLRMISPERDPLLIISNNPMSDVALKRLGYSKSLQLQLKSIHNIMKRESLLLHASHSISTAQLILYSLNALPSSSVTALQLTDLMTSLKASLHTLPFSNNSSTHLHSFCPSDVHGLLLLLETSLIGHPEERDTSLKACLDPANYEWLIEGLVQLGIMIQDKRLEGVDSLTVRRLTEEIFRVLVSLTNADEKWCEMMTQNSSALGFIMRETARADDLRWKALSYVSTEGTSTIKQEEYDYKRILPLNDNLEPNVVTQALDRLCLCLGLVLNLVQFLPEVKNIIRNLRLKSTCPLLDPSCRTTCVCANAQSALHILIDVYNHQVYLAGVTITPSQPHQPQSTNGPIKHESPSPELSLQNNEDAVHASADASFLLGHLCILLGMLMMGSPENQETILSSITGASDTSHVEVLARMTEQTNEIGEFYTILQRRYHAGYDDGDRIGSVVGRTIEEDCGKELTKDVLAFFKSLRSSLL